jgi:hypothetical protein
MQGVAAVLEEVREQRGLEVLVVVGIVQAQLNILRQFPGLQILVGAAAVMQITQPHQV